MKKSLCCQAGLKFFFGVLMVGGLLFLAAGSFHYWQGWLLMAILFIPMLGIGLLLMVKNPDLPRNRLNARETQVKQRWLVRLSGLMFTLGFVVAGLTYRWHGEMLPNWVSWMGAVLFLFAYGMYAEVLRENRYVSRVVEVQAEQEVIDHGLYGMVRHPMYSATLLLFLSIPIILGSPISFVIFLMYPFILVMRIQNEEQVLEKELTGYSEYKKRVRYKLILLIW